MASSYETYKVQDLINQYRANPDMFNDDQLDELERLASDNQIKFKRMQSPFSMRRAMQQASAGFIEGFTTLDLIPKEPRNTGEAIFRQLGHLAGFAPSIMKAPIIGVGKAIAKLTGRESKDVLSGTITRSVLNGIDFIGDKSIPMIAQRKSIGLFNKGIKKAGMDSLEYMKRGASGRAIAEEAVGLAGASAISSVWKGPDAIIDSFLGGAILGGAFGGIGQFGNVARFYKGTPEQIERANAYLRTGLGSLTAGLPSTLRNDPTEMQIYEYLLGGYFGYQTRPAREREAGRFLTSEQRYNNRDGGAEILDPRRSGEFKSMSKEAQDYLLYDHPMPKSSSIFPNSQQLGGTTGQALGFLESKFPNRNFYKEAVDALGSKATERTVRDWYASKAGSLYSNLKFREFAVKPTANAYKIDDQLDFNDPNEIVESYVTKISDALYPSVKDKFKTQDAFTDKIVKLKQNAFMQDAPLTEKFMSDMRTTLGRDLNKQENAELRKWFLQNSMPVRDVLYADIQKQGMYDVATVHSGSKMELADGTSIGEKYYELPINKFTGGGFQLLTHVTRNNGKRVDKILDSFPNYKNKSVISAIDSYKMDAIHDELYNQGKYVFSGIKDKNFLMVAPIKTNINGIEITKDMIWDAMSGGVRGVNPEQVKAKLREAYEQSSRLSRLPESIHSDVYISNILHHGTMHNLIGNTGNIGGLVKMLQGKYVTNASDFNKRMQLLGNKMASLDPASFADLRPDGQMNVMFVADADMLRHMGGKEINGKWDNESMSDGGIISRQAFHDRTLSSVGLPEAGMLKPVIASKGLGGVIATKSSGQRATEPWERFMAQHDVDHVVFDTSFKIGPDYARTPIKYEQGQYSTDAPSVYKVPIKDMQISLGTYENIAKATKNQEIAMQVWNQQGYEQAGFVDEFYKMVTDPETGIQAGSPDAISMLKAYTKTKDIKDSAITAEQLSQQMALTDMSVKELPLDFVIKHMLDATGDKKIGALLFDKIHKLDKNKELDIDTFEYDSDSDFQAYHERAQRIAEANIGNYDSRISIFKDNHMSILKKFIIGKYSNPMMHESGKAWLKPVTPDMISTIDGNVKSIKEGHIYLDNAHKQMPVVLGNKRYTLGEIWDFHTRAKPKPKGTTFKAINDALELVVIRTPSDSPSGTRVLRFGGFTNQRGAGAITHHKDDYYLGGADKDSDSIKIFQGFTPKLKSIIKKNANEKEHYRPNSKKYNKDYAERLDNDFKGIKDKETLFYMSGRVPSGYKTDALDFILPKMHAFSPYYRELVARNSKNGKDGLGNGLTAKVYLQNIIDYVAQKNMKTGGVEYGMEPIYINTPYGKLEIRVKEGKVNGVDRMQYFRDLGAMIVNKSADASNDPTILNYSNFRNLLYRNILDVKMKFKGFEKKGWQTVDKYRNFTKYIESSPEMKPVVRSIHVAKTNNNFRVYDKKELEKFIEQGSVIIPKKENKTIDESKLLVEYPSHAYDKMNLHTGERVVMFEDKPNVRSLVRMPNVKKITTIDGKKYITLTREFKPNKPEFVDLEADLEYIASSASGRDYESYPLLVAKNMANKMEMQKRDTYADRLQNIYNVFLRNYLNDNLGLDLKNVNKELKKVILDNTSILLDDVPLVTAGTLKGNMFGNRNLGLDNFGKALGSLSSIESLNTQFLQLEKYLKKKNSDVSLKKMTEWMYAKNKELKSLQNDDAINGTLETHMSQITERALEKNLNPDPFIKYYHTLVMSPLVGTSKMKFDSEGKAIEFASGNYSPYIHGSRLIPYSTRRAWYKKYDGFVNKIEKLLKIDKEERYIDTVGGLKGLNELPTAKTDKIVEQLSLNLKDVKKPKTEKSDLDYLALNQRDAKAVDIFKKHINEHPIARENFQDFFSDFTSNYGDMIPRNAQDITMKDVYALNEYFKRANDPTDFKFHLKYFLMDPKYVDEFFKAKGIAKKVHEYTIKNPDTKKNVAVAKIMGPYGEISQYNKNVKDRGFDIDTTKLKRKHAEFFKDIEKLDDKDASIEQIIDFREGASKGPLTPELARLNDKITNFFKDLGDNYIYTKNLNGERANWSEIDTNFGEWHKSNKGKLNKYMRWNKDGTFDFDHFYNNVVAYRVASGNVDDIQKIVGIDGEKRYIYERRLQDRLGVDYSKKVLAERKKVGYEGIGFIDPNTYVPHIDFNLTEGAREAFKESVYMEAQRTYDKVYDLAIKDPELKNQAEEIAERAMINYYKKMEGIGNMQSEFVTIQDIADLGEIDSSVLNKKLRQLGFSTRIGPLEARTSNLKGYDKSSKIFNNYIDKVVNGYYTSLSVIHGDKKINELKEWGLTRKVPKKESDYFDNLYKTADRRKTRRSTDPEKVQLVKNPRYRNYTDVWADYLKLHLQTVLGHQTYFPEQIIREVERGIDPLYLKDKRNLFYLTSDQNMIDMYEKLWQKKKFTSAPFIKHMFKNAPLNPKDRKEYFSRKLHEFGRMEAQYELMTLLANTGTYATNIVGGSQMIIGSAGLRNFANVFSKKKVYDMLLTSNGKPVIKLLDGTFVKDRAGITQYLKEQGIIDNFIQHEFEYNEGLKLNLKKAGVSLKNFQRDLTVAMKGKRPNRKESIMEVVNRYGVKDIMLKYGSFFMRHSEQVNRTNAYMAHAMQVMNRFGRQAKELSLADPFVHEMAMKGIENTQFLYQNSFRPMFMRTATGKVLTRFKLFAWNSIRVRRDFYKQAKMYGFRKGSLEFERAKDLFLTDMFMMALGGAFMFSIFDTALAPPYDWIQSLADWMYGDKKERDMAFFGSKLGPANLLKPPIARIPEAMGQILSGDWETFSDYTAYTLFPFGRMARQVNQLTDDRVGRGLERAPEILVRFPYNQIQSRIDRAKRRAERAEEIEEFLG